MKKIRKYIMIIVIIIIIIALDQIMKVWITNNKNEIVILQGILKLNYVENTKNILKIALTEILVLGILIRFLVRQIENMSIMPKISLSFITAGGISNFIDKIIRGKVIDYIDISELINKFPAFNFADIFIILGFIIFAITVFIDLMKFKSKKVGGKQLGKEYNR